MGWYFTFRGRPCESASVKLPVVAFRLRPVGNVPLATTYPVGECVAVIFALSAFPSVPRILPEVTTGRVAPQAKSTEAKITIARRAEIKAQREEWNFIVMLMGDRLCILLTLKSNFLINSRLRFILRICPRPNLPHRSRDF